MPNLHVPINITCCLKSSGRVKSNKPVSGTIYLTVDNYDILFFAETKNFLPDTIEIYRYGPSGEGTIVYHAPVRDGPRIEGRIVIEAVSTSIYDFLNNIYNKKIGVRLIHHADEITELSGILNPEKRIHGGSGNAHRAKYINKTIPS